MNPAALFFSLFIAFLGPGMQVVWGELLGPYRRALERLRSVEEQSEALCRLGCPVEARRLVRVAEFRLVVRVAFEAYTRRRPWFYSPFLVGWTAFCVSIYGLLDDSPGVVPAVLGLTCIGVAVVGWLIQLWLVRRAGRSAIKKAREWLADRRRLRCRTSPADAEEPAPAVRLVASRPSSSGAVVVRA